MPEEQIQSFSEKRLETVKLRVRSPLKKCFLFKQISTYIDCMNVQSVDLKIQTIAAQKQSENIFKNQFLVIFYY